MAGRNGITAGGNWIIDRIKIVDSYPKEGNLANILRSEPPANGGAPYNVLLDLAKLGVDIPLQGVGVLGDDENAEIILNDCHNHRVDSSLLVKRPGAETSYTDVVNVASTGHRTFFHARGANAMLDVEDFDLNRITGKICLLGYLLLLDKLDSPDARFGTRAARLLAGMVEAGIETAVDVVSENSDRFKKIVMPALPYTDYLIINEVETAKITGVEVRDERGVRPEAIVQAAEILVKAGVRKRLVIHYREGAFSYRKDDAEQVFTDSLVFPSELVKGSTGAGDAFCAGCLFGIHSGWDTAKLLDFACGMAACSLTHPGASAGVKPFDEIWGLVSAYKKRP